MKEKRYHYITDGDYAKAESNGIKKTTLEARVRRHGWDIDRAATTKPRSLKETHWKEWKDKSIVCYDTYLSRLNNGMTPEQAATTPFIDYDERHQREYGFTKEHFARALSIGVDRKTVLQRYLKLGWDVEKCVTTPKMTKSEAASLSTKKRRERNLRTVWK